MERVPPEAAGDAGADPPVPEGARAALEALRASLGGDFEVVRLLGRGSAATVFLARDRALGVPVAIKVLGPDRARDETARRRFEREARAAASLADHPNTVGVTRFGRLPDQTPYLVMQYVNGRTLDERLAAEGRLDAREARTILAGVASALAVAHAKGIVHRDVRLGNVLWDEEHARPRLTDFGIAAVLTPGGVEGTRLTKTGHLLGDTRHLSPEALLDEEVTELADMYQFGLLGYELLAGRGPYDAHSPADWIQAHLNKEPLDLRELRPDVPEEVALLLRRCLAKTPRHRPAARDVARVLEVGGESAGAAPTPQPGDVGELVRRRVPQIVLFTVGIGVTLIGLADALEELLPSQAKLVTVIFVIAAVLASAVVGWFHGERGRQKATPLEYLLLGAIAIAWSVATVLAVL